MARARLMAPFAAHVHVDELLGVLDLQGAELRSSILRVGPARDLGRRLALVSVLHRGHLCRRVRHAAAHACSHGADCACRR